MKPCDTFFHRHNVKYPNFNCLFQNISKAVETSKSTQFGQQNPRCNYTKFQMKIQSFFGYVQFFQNIQIFANFTIGMIGKELGHLPKCVSSITILLINVNLSVC